MLGSAALLGAGAVAGVAAIRSRLEARARAAGAPLPTPSDQPSWMEAIAQWQPQRPRDAGARIGVAAWAAPLTSLGLVAGAVGRPRWAWDDRRGILVATSVRAPARQLLAWSGAAALTLGHVVLCRDDQPSARLLDHEALHARQAERFGILFAPAYILLTAWTGYRNNPFERAARTASEGG